MSRRYAPGGRIRSDPSVRAASGARVGQKSIAGAHPTTPGTLAHSFAPW
jgi:hypothetical protein